MMTTQQERALARARDRARQVGGTVFVLEERADGVVLLSDGTGTFELHPEGDLRRAG